MSKRKFKAQEKRGSLSTTDTRFFNLRRFFKDGGGKQLIKALVLIMLIVTTAVGFLVYYPRHAAYFVPGLEIRTDCNLQPKGELLGKIWSTELYTLSIGLHYVPESVCRTIRIYAPGPVVRLATIYLT